MLSTKLWLITTYWRLALTLPVSMIACASKPVIIPDSRQVKVSDEVGWLKISAGNLRELYRDNAELLNELEQCRTDLKEARSK